MPTRIRLLYATLACLLAAGCATKAPPALPPAADLFTDSAFRAPATPVPTRDQLFAMNEPMRAYLRTPRFAKYVRENGPARGLFNALYTTGELKVEYDSTITRTAPETFAAKRGNCLSLVVMTAAFARHMNLDVDFQNVLVDEQWSRSGNLYFSSTHVNLRLAAPRDNSRVADVEARGVTIDFLPPDELGRYRAHSLDEETVTAMYLNNRAAEELAEQRTDDAYWYARAAIHTAPNFISAYNTLGVVYSNHGDLVAAERVFKRALMREPEDPTLMRNLVPVLAKLGKTEESTAMRARLAAIEPFPPFHFFHLGLQALEREQYAEAKALFTREVRRSPYYHEFHFWLAIAHWRLGEANAAREEMELAVDTSTTERSAQKYSSKLAYLRSLSAGGSKKRWQ